MTKDATHDIAPEKFERALAVLETEQEAMKLSRAQRRSLRLYTIFVWVFLSLLITIVIYRLALRSRLEDIRGIHHVLIGLFSLGAFLCVACAAVLLLLNVPVMVKVVRNKRHFRRLGFSDVSDSLWKEYQKTHRASAILAKTSAVIGVLFLGFGVVVVIFSLRENGARSIAFVAAGFYGVLSLLFLMFYVLQICKAWLETMTLQWKDATRLKEVMVSSGNSAHKAGLARIPVPADALKQFARIESLQISRSRAEAVAEAIAAPAGGFSVLLSQQALEAKSRLESGDRLRVEDALDALMLQPVPKFAERETGTGLLRKPVEGTGLELTYDVDDTARQVRVMSLRQAIAGGASRA